MARTLRPCGHWLSCDPHQSRVRFLFDWAMRVSKLYDELASDNPLISAGDAERWNREAGLDAELKLHFFLPPYVLNLMSPRAAERWLQVTDRWFNRFGLGSLAGVIVVNAVKRAPASANGNVS